MKLISHNPDVLDCIANLSNDEVFTPPEIANAMLDQLEEAWAADNHGENIWANPNVKFLDPCAKSGVFLREITNRLVDGLSGQIPDLQQRVNHVLTKQIYGIAITTLTGMLARRTVYCSKWANRKHSICTEFDDDDGKIWFRRTEHTWAGGKQQTVVDPNTGQKRTAYTQRRCDFCGATEEGYDRGPGLETHAYAFIHTDNIHQLLREIFGEPVQFDVVIGNPPYQLADGGYGKSATPIYQEFVTQAKNLEPRYLSMIVPSRWFAGGKHLDDFRGEMLQDGRLTQLVDYLNAADVFPGVDLKGGVCYFLWDRDRQSECNITTYFDNKNCDHAARPLLVPGADVFIRFNQGVDILEKVLTAEGLSLPIRPDRSFERLVSSRKPFGLDTTYKGKQHKTSTSLKLYQNGGTAYIERDELRDPNNLIDLWKVYVNYVGPGNNNFPHRVLVTPFIGEPRSASTETYLAVGGFATEDEAISARSYMTTRLFRFLVLLRKASQHVTSKVYGFVPTQSWDRIWTDEMLYEKYGITEDEISFIESMVRPMEDE